MYHIIIYFTFYFISLIGLWWVKYIRCIIIHRTKEIITKELQLLGTYTLMSIASRQSKVRSYEWLLKCVGKTITIREKWPI